MADKYVTRQAGQQILVDSPAAGLHLILNADPPTGLLLNRAAMASLDPMSSSLI
jgi:hypothetical protein